jgi:hypothetical protein
MAAKPVRDVSEEQAALFERADLAGANARLLIQENDRWRRLVREQFEEMTELGAEFKVARRIEYRTHLPLGR